VVRRNLHERQTADTSPSDADVAVMHRQLESLEPPSETNITLTLTPGAEIDEELLKNWLNPPL
jgi:predicted kinase